MKRILWAASLLLLGAAARPIDWNLAQDWTNGQNPVGPWTIWAGQSSLAFGTLSDPNSFLTGHRAFSPARTATNHLPFIFKSEGKEKFGHDWAPGHIVVHPRDVYNGGPNGEARIKWTSPISGKISINGGVWKGLNSGRTVRWQLSRGSSVIAQGAVGPLEPSSSGAPALFQAGSLGQDLSDLAVTRGQEIVLQLSPSGENLPAEYTGVDFRIEGRSVITLTAKTLGNQPQPLDTTPSVYRVGVAENLTTRIDYKVFRIHIKSLQNAGKNVRLWIEDVDGSGHHNHGPAVRPTGYLGTTSQINNLLAQRNVEIRRFVGGAFNVTPLVAFGVNPPPIVPNHVHRIAYAAGSQRIALDSVPTNSFANGVIVALDNNGMGTLDYLAPEISGIERIVCADSTSGVNSTELTMVYRYSGLQPVPADNDGTGLTNTGLQWAGTLDDHHNGGLGRPGSHYAHPNAVIAIGALGRQYRHDLKQAGSGSPPPLRLNDVSLPWGGMFDINKKFVYPTHLGHRDGFEFDIGTTPNYPVPGLERVLAEHPYWLLNADLWKKENPTTGTSKHYHLRVLATGLWRKGPSIQSWKIEPTGMVHDVKWNSWDPVLRSLVVTVRIQNRGPYPATVRLTGVQLTGGATLLGGAPVEHSVAPTDFKDLSFTVGSIPVGGTDCTLVGSGTDTLGTRPFERVDMGSSPPALIPEIKFRIPGV